MVGETLLLLRLAWWRFGLATNDSALSTFSFLMLLYFGMFVVTLGIGWAVWTWRSWARGTTPGKSLLGLTVFGTDTRRPATRARMALRALVYQSVVVLIGVVTLGLGWLYCVAAALGTGRRTVYDEWSHAVLLQRPRKLG